LGAAWLLVILRSAGVLGLGVPLAVSGRLRGPGSASRLVVFCGLADTVAYASYVVAASEGGVAVPAVISSQFAAVTVLIGMTAMGERLTRLQVGGIVGILAGVALVSAAQA
jgi:drug/metabolite transporter (DMT)-like permease